MSGDSVLLLLCGDVMTGRGIDQILPHPGDPRLCEPYVQSALDYVELAERVHGPIRRPVAFDYVWGDALDELKRARPDARIVNLETAVTGRGDCAPKGINYRMHPANLPCLTAAAIDCCALANNHVLDWGEDGLLDTLDSLTAAGLKTAGAGRDAAAAAAPAIVDLAARGRVLVFGCGSESSGIPPAWRAAASRPGVNLVADLSDSAIGSIAAQVRAVKRPGDIAVLSLHWGYNWDYRIPQWQRRFAHGIVDRAGIDIVHGHSSHHAKAIEVHRGKLILYGCGDFLNDYEGIGGEEEFRPNLVLMYLPTVDPGDGRLLALSMVPLRLRRFRLERATAEEGQWLRQVLTREGEPFETRAEIDGDGRLTLRWR
jgi:poly-gamma-glutamate synthesis protein (capsule biosynthesis protein)